MGYAVLSSSSMPPSSGSPELVGGWRATLSPLVDVPQGLGSLAFNVLTATLVYMDYANRLRWNFVNFL